MPLLRALIIGFNLTSSSPFVRNTSTATRTIIKEHVKKEVIAPTPTCASTVLGNTPANTAPDPGALALNCSIQKTNKDKQRPSKASNNLEIETSIKVAPFFQYLQGYKPNFIKFLTEGFTFGFKIPYTGQRTFRLSKNLSSIHGNEQILYQRIDQELRANRIASPFTQPPFPNIQVSPLGLVPKMSPGEFRLIHHLSYPEGNSINSKIPQEFCTVQYQSIDIAIALI